jgi:hypothetical protein
VASFMARANSRRPRASRSAACALCDPVSETPMFVPAVDHGDAGLALGGFAEMLIASRAILSTSENP